MNRFEKPSPVFPGVLQQILSPFFMFLFSLVEISESPQSFIPVPICGVTRGGQFEGNIFLGHLDIWMAKARFPLDLPFNWSNWTSSTLWAISPSLLCENPVSWCFLWVFNLSHPITKKTYMTFTQAMGCSGLSSRSASSARHAEPEDAQMPWANSFTPGLGR